MRFEPKTFHRVQIKTRREVGKLAAMLRRRHRRATMPDTKGTTTKLGDKIN